MPLVTSGVEKGNLRELALARMGQLGLKCRDVRTREAGIQDIHNNVRSHHSLPKTTCIPTASAAGRRHTSVCMQACTSLADFMASGWHARVATAATRQAPLVQVPAPTMPID